ncbi:MAG: ABC-type multidrug transport system [Thermodesulfobacterium sp.]|uniref:ABC-type multidrug transport system n=1 Tax=Candidatus Thermodesulfobacterium syntrophicum TaxID=3060442 RepID=A0AAE3P3U9_9BACT|nr:ABC-type multidrug transport system [Candidatus Thermodesulfobacterium syntrophicum]
MSNTALKIENLVKKYPSVLALKGVSFEIKEKELFALLGPNGAGKTTIIKIIAGLTNPTAGKIYLFQKNIFNNLIWSKGQIGIVPQHINLDIELTVEENLLIHGLLYQMPLSLIKKRISELLELANLKERKNSKIKELSEGLKRRVLIIRALLHQPKLLLLDEPTVGLDPHIRRKIWSFIKNIQKTGTTILLTTHYMEEAEFLADKVAFIFSGKIIAINTPQNFIHQLGNYAVDVYLLDKLKTFYFKEKEEAEKELLKYSKNHFVSLRRVTLEDVFLKYVEKNL